MQRTSRAIREGSIGLFALLGLAVLGGITIWLRGGGWGDQPYQFIVSFPTVDGMQIGAPVRFRGVTVGKIIKLRPNSNEVEATLEIASTNLQIPRKVIAQTNRYGLIGDAIVDLLPLTTLPPEASKIDPLSKECDSSIVICDNDRLIGENAPDIFTSMIQLAETYSDQEFVDNLNNATRNASITAAKLARLTDDASIVLKATQKDISTISRSANQTAIDASRLITNADSLVTTNRTRITQAVDETTQLVSNLNLLIGENRVKIVRTIDQLNQASTDVGKLAVNLNSTLGTIDQALETADTQSLVKDLQTLTANAVAVSSNLRNLSNQFNDPTTIVTLQQTLDSARATFANTQKLTSDLDELLGDPQLRENIRILINGLSNLVSSGENLEEQLRIAQSLELTRQSLVLSSTNRLELDDFQPKRPYILSTHLKIIEDYKPNKRSEKQKLEAASDH